MFSSLQWLYIADLKEALNNVPSQHSNCCFSLLLVGCKLDETARATMPPDALLTADLALELYLSGDAAGLRLLSTDELASKATDSALAGLFGYLGTGEVVDTAIIRARVASSTATGTTVTLIYSVELADRNLVVTVITQKLEDKFLLGGLFVNVVDKGPAGVPALSFKNASFAHYLMLTGFALIPLFVLGTLIDCLRRKNVKRRILWCLFILFGVGSLTFAWSTGDFVLRLLQLQLFSVALRIPYDWVFEFGIPVGAIMWWTVGRKTPSESAA
jgi:hypothetical protein